MKKLILPTLLLGALISSNASAEMYYALQVGQADVSMEDLDENSTTYGGLLGYNFSENFGAEIFYTNYDRAESGGYDINFHSIGASLKGKFNLTEETSIFAKVGYANLALDITSGFNNYGSADINKPVYGAGASYKFSETMGLGLEFSSQQTEADAINNISLSLNWNYWLRQDR